MPGWHWLLAVELAVFLVPDCPHLLAVHLFSMGDAPLTHPPLQGAQAAEIQTGVFLLQSLHRLLACEQGIGHQPRQHQGPTPQGRIHPRAVGALWHIPASALGRFALPPQQPQAAQKDIQILVAC